MSHLRGARFHSRELRAFVRVLERAFRVPGAQAKGRHLPRGCLRGGDARGGALREPLRAARFSKSVALAAKVVRPPRASALRFRRGVDEVLRRRRRRRRRGARSRRGASLVRVRPRERLLRVRESDPARVERVALGPNVLVRVGDRGERARDVALGVGDDGVRLGCDFFRPRRGGGDGFKLHAHLHRADDRSDVRGFARGGRDVRARRVHGHAHARRGRSSAVKRRELVRDAERPRRFFAFFTSRRHRRRESVAFATRVVHVCDRVLGVRGGVDVVDVFLRGVRRDRGGGFAFDEDVRRLGPVPFDVFEVARRALQRTSVLVHGALGLVRGGGVPLDARV
eukprot:31314-Pelagococcus_subviridis.AAC.42